MPVPLPPCVTTIQDALLVAVQVHPVCVDTETDPAPPTAVNDWLFGLIV